MDRSSNASYYESEFAHVSADATPFYRMQIENDSTGAHTRWLNISGPQLARILEVLTNGDSNSQEA